MALRPLVFGARLKEKGRSVRVRAGKSGYVVEESRSGRKTRKREHASLEGALSDMAASWRKRLH